MANNSKSKKIDNLPSLFYKDSRSNLNQEVLLRCHKNSIKSYTLSDCQSAIRSWAYNFKRAGFQRKCKVGIWMSNRPEWVFADMSTMLLGGATVPIYSTLSPLEIKHILSDSGCRFLIIESDDMLVKIKSILNELDQLWEIIVVDGKCNQSDLVGQKKIWNLSEWLSSEEDEVVSKTILTGQLIEKIAQNDVATIIYTSGTTGMPKGVVLTHGNLIHNISCVFNALDVSEKDKHLSFLPLSHVFERSCGYYLMLYAGAVIAYGSGIDHVLQDAIRVKPTFLMAVPRFYEKAHNAIMDKISVSKGLKKRLSLWALNVGRLQANGKLSKQSISWKIANRLVFSKIKKTFGGNIRFGVSGGAPLPKKIADFFKGAGLLIIEGYGLTETSPVISFNRIDKYKFGTVGLPLDDVKVKISEEGEILTKSDSVMQGYYHRPEETQQLLSEGWFSTGDLGEIDEDGFLKITGRIKELIVLSGGKKVAPNAIEPLFEDLPCVQRCVLYGEGKNFITALIVPNYDEIERLAKKRGYSFASREDLIKSKWVLDEIQSRISDCQSKIAPYEQIKYFDLMLNDFSLEAGELTPTLKIRRSVICSKYANQMNRFYDK